MKNEQFEVQVYTNTDIAPAERFASVRHLESDCGCDYYENGDEIDWEDSNGLNCNCADEIKKIARQLATEALAK